MAIDSLTVWQNEWANLPKVIDDSWKENLANYIEARILNLKLSSYVPNTNISFSFNKDTFIAGLSSVDSGLGNGAIVIGQAFSAAMLLSTLSLTAPISIGNPTPTTTYSSVTTSIFNVLSASAAASKIAELAGAPNVLDPLESEFPIKLREAALLISADITGLDASTPTPLPLVDLARPVI
jgi:hypothetical protein